MASEGERRGAVHLAYWCGKPRERDHLDDVSVNGGTVLKWIF
jgi:hypothetical protein